MELSKNTDKKGKLSFGEKVKKEKPKGPQKLKFTYNEQKEYETIENDISSLEEELEKLLNDIENQVKLILWD